MARNGAAIHVEGLYELRKALRQVDPQLQKNLRGRLKKIGDKVAAKVRAKVPKRSGRAARSVKSGMSGNVAYVKGGQATVPYYGWLDYGGTLKKTGKRHGTQVRPFLQDGRYLYPTVNEMRSETERAALDAFEETARDLGLK